MKESIRRPFHASAPVARGATLRATWVAVLLVMSWVAPLAGVACPARAADGARPPNPGATVRAPAFAMLDPGAPAYACEEDLIEVIFATGARVRLRGGTPVDLSGGDALAGLPGVLGRVAWSTWSRIIETPEETIDALTAEGEARTGRRLSDPNNMVHLRVGPGADIWEISRELEALPGVRSARPVPRPMALPTPDFEPQQGYLRPASATPTGIDADYAWTQPGGDGANVHICDLEYSWNWLHDDLYPVNEIHIYLQDPQANENHGTAVLGVLGSHDNGYGTTGIGYAGQLYTCGTYFKPWGGPTYSWNVPGAIIDAAASGSFYPGDMLLIEHQWDFGGGALVPIEWWTNSSPNQTFNGVYEAIQWAIDVKDLIVVEPAGNGAINLDNLNWYGDSGAIIVGAGGAYAGGTWSEGDLQRLSFSSYGTRVDLQGWGENVVTTGYGTLYDDEGVNRYYTATFDGTSSAAPVVAGAVVACSGRWRTAVSTRWPMPATYVRSVLKATGTPQITPPAGNIGPRPDLLAAFPRLVEWVDVTAAPLNDTGGFASWGDYDNDDDLDMYLINSPYVTNKLLRNDGGGAFSDVTPDLLKDLNGYSTGSVWGDYDNDGDLDLYLANDQSANKLFRNDGGTFVDATAFPLNIMAMSPSPTWIDYDNDGDIDLYVACYGVANKLLRNNGDGSFTNVTSGPEGDTGYATCSAWADYDNDGDQDLYLVNWNSSNRLLRNDAGTFVDVTASPLNVNEGGNAVWGDYDNDGDLDLYLVIGANGMANRLFRNDGGTFTQVACSPLDDTDQSGFAHWIDADNDGDLDLYLEKSPAFSRMFWSNGAGSFTEETHGLLMFSASASFGDFDDDGDVDLYRAISFPASHNTLIQNNAAGGNHWLQVRLVGTVSNRGGIGARLRVVTDAGAQIREVKADCLEHTLIATFGLGAETVVDTLQVFWPGGTVQDSLAIAADQRVVIVQAGGEGVDDPVSSLATHLERVSPQPCLPYVPVTFRYEIGTVAPARLTVHDVSGRLIRVLHDARAQMPGRYSVAWDGRDDRGQPVAGGVYFCRLDVNGDRHDQRVLLMR